MTEKEERMIGVIKKWTLRRLAMNLLKKDATKKRSIKASQLNAAWDLNYLAHLLGF